MDPAAHSSSIMKSIYALLSGTIKVYYIPRRRRSSRQSRTWIGKCSDAVLQPAFHFMLFDSALKWGAKRSEILYIYGARLNTIGEEEHTSRQSFSHSATAVEGCSAGSNYKTYYIYNIYSYRATVRARSYEAPDCSGASRFLAHGRKQQPLPTEMAVMRVRTLGS